MIRLLDSEWERIRDRFPEENIPDGRPGRKPVLARQVLEAVLWILNTGTQWHMLPQCYPHYKQFIGAFRPGAGTMCCVRF
jgi:transposase